MENMREQNWQSLLFVISIVVFGTGIYFYLKNRHARHLSSVPPIEAHHQTKESAAKEKKEHEEKVEEVAEEHEEKSEHHENQHHAPAVSTDSSKNSEHEEKVAHHALAAHKKEMAHEEDGEDKKEGQAEEKAEKGHEMKALTTLPIKEGAAKNLCESIGAPQSLGEFKVNVAEWNKVIVLFHKAKELLLTHLAKVEKDIPTATAEMMKKQLKSLKIAPPPWKEEPHLKWQSIGLWTRKESGATTVHVSEEFFRLFAKDAKRAQFEMVRLVAQSWAPCELARLEGKAVWTDLLSCLDLSKESCSDDFYSEGGWAVSSALAVTISPPKCTIPAFSSPEGHKCLNSLGLVPVAKTEGTKE